MAASGEVTLNIIYISSVCHC